MKIISLLLKSVLVLILLLAVMGGGLIWYITTMPPKSVLQTNIERFTGYQTEIAGEPTLALWPAFELKMPNITVQAQQGTKPLLTADEIYVRLPAWQQLWAGLAVEEVRLMKPQIYLETYADGQVNWRAAGSTAPTDEAASAGTDFVFIPVKQAVIEDLQFEHRTPQDVTQLDRMNLTLGGADPAALALNVRGRWNRNSFDANGTFDIVNLDAIGVDVSARLPAMTAQATGRIVNKAAWQGQLDISSPSIKQTIKQYAGAATAANLPFDENLRLMLAGQLSPERIDLSKLDLRLGNALAAVGTVEAQPFKQNITADITFDRLNLDQLGYCGAAGKSKSGGSGGGNSSTAGATGAPWTDDVISTESLAQLTGTLNISLPRITCADAPVTAANLQATMNNGRINLAPLEFFLPEKGRILVQGYTTFGQGVQGSLQTAIEQVALELFLPPKAAKQTHVPLNGTVNLNFAGETSRELARSLAGEVHVTATEGVIPGDDLFQILLATGPLTGFKSDVKEIRLENLQVHYVLTDGIAVAKNVKLESVGQKINLSATGTLDLPAWQIDHTIEPAVKNAGLLNVPVKVTGALDNPNFQAQIVNKNTVRALLDKVLSNDKNSEEGTDTSGESNPKPEKIIKDVLQNLF